MKRLASFVTVILMVVFAWILGRLVWQAWQPEQTTFVAPVAAQVAAKSTGKEASYQLSSLVNQNFFGRYTGNTKSKPVVAPIKDAPKTRLNLTLVGVVATSDESQGLAVIANRGQQSTYGIGEVIQGTRASLARVLPDRVFIRNNGRDEVLILAGVDENSAGKNASTTSRPVKSSSKRPSPNANNTVDVSSIKKEILSNPQALLKYITLSQATDSSGLLGYRVGPGSDKRFFDASGLQNGDIAVELNGADLRNPSELGQIWQNLADAAEVSLTVMRNGQQHVVYISL
ncbi:type II secretion system protein GspC [Veronia pacifica]|uniref:Type II secretion system protein GspC n=1 Tax=Veronia pacifica TaxID=1080227 RepID=A0A1C3EJQ8_9GAMM|nr:type II secretion system protein GspC [Veronia pacifica]